MLCCSKAANLSFQYYHIQNNNRWCSFHIWESTYWLDVLTNIDRIGTRRRESTSNPKKIEAGQNHVIRVYIPFTRSNTILFYAFNLGFRTIDTRFSMSRYLRRDTVLHRRRLHFLSTTNRQVVTPIRRASEVHTNVQRWGREMVSEFDNWCLLSYGDWEEDIGIAWNEKLLNIRTITHRFEVLSIIKRSLGSFWNSVSEMETDLPFHQAFFIGCAYLNNLNISLPVSFDIKWYSLVRE